MSTFQVVRLASGDTIQVRSGVLQGLGPQGARGPTGPQGPVGAEGPQGEQGPIGRLEDFITTVTVGTSQSVASNVDHTVAFGNVVLDELSAAASSTNFVFIEDGGYQMSGFVRFLQPDAGGDGFRRVRVVGSVQGVVSEVQIPAVNVGDTSVPIYAAFRASLNETFNVIAYQSDNEAVGISEGRLNIFRVGSGPRGLQGIQGAIGPVGPAGPKGDKGDTGSAGGGYATIDELGATT